MAGICMEGKMPSIYVEEKLYGSDAKKKPLEGNVYCAKLLL